MNIIWLDLGELTPYPNNPRKNDASVDRVAASIREFGFKQPIVTDKDKVIVAGHTRYEAAKKLGWEKVPVIIADDLTEEQAKAYRLADNKAGEASEWDFDLLDVELDGIFDIDMSEFGFDLDDEETEETEIEEDEVPEPPEEPKARVGDLYILGKHRLICGDSTDIAVIDRLMDGVKADMWLSDPPYNAEIVGGSHAISAEERKKQGKLTIQNDKMSNDDFKDFLTNAFTTAWTILKEGASFYIWYTSREVVNFQRSLEYAGFLVKQELIWNKNSLVMGRQDYQQKHEPCLYGWKDGGSHNWYGDRKQTTVIDFERPSKSESHPTMKPIGLISQQIKNSSKQDDIVFDGFGGSGSTLIACEQLNRKCYMCELDPHYVDVILQRYINLKGTDEDVYLIRDGERFHYREISA